MITIKILGKERALTSVQLEEKYKASMSGFNSSEVFGNAQFHLQTINFANLDQAQQSCIELNGTLGSFRNQEEFDFVQEFLETFLVNENIRTIYVGIFNFIFDEEPGLRTETSSFTFIDKFQDTSFINGERGELPWSTNTIEPNGNGPCVGYALRSNFVTLNRLDDFPCVDTTILPFLCRTEIDNNEEDFSILFIGAGASCCVCLCILLCCLIFIRKRSSGKNDNFILEDLKRKTAPGQTTLALPVTPGYSNHQTTVPDISSFNVRSGLPELRGAIPSVASSYRPSNRELHQDDDNSTYLNSIFDNQSVTTSHVEF